MNDLFSQDIFSNEMAFFLPKLIIATICGGLIGIERGTKRSVAGLRTNILICVGSAIYTAFGLYSSMELRRTAISMGEGGSLGGYGDPVRLWGQIITGIGFIGAGVIFRPAFGKYLGAEGSSESPRGVTTAAYIWFNCAIGMLIGSGLASLAAIITAGFILVMLAVEFMEERIINGAQKLMPKKLMDNEKNKDDQEKENK